MRLRLFIVLFILPYTNITFFEEGGGVRSENFYNMRRFSEDSLQNFMRRLSFMKMQLIQFSKFYSTTINKICIPTVLPTNSKG